MGETCPYTTSSTEETAAQGVSSEWTYTSSREKNRASVNSTWKHFYLPSPVVNFSLSCNITSCTCVYGTKSTANAKAFWGRSRCSCRISPHNSLQTSAPGKVLGETLSFPALLEKGKLLPRPYKLFQKLPQSKLAGSKQKQLKTSGIFQVGVIRLLLETGSWVAVSLKSFCLCFLILVHNKKP